LAGKFQQTLEGDFVYLGSSMAELTQAIYDNTDALLKQVTEQLQSKVDTAQLMQNMAENLGWSEGVMADISDWRGWENDKSTSSAKGYLGTLIQEATNSNIDLSMLGIEGLSNKTKVEKLTED
jgi:glucose-6-phosphate-specific signal transduction histidine kinase